MSLTNDLYSRMREDMRHVNPENIEGYLDYDENSNPVFIPERDEFGQSAGVNYQSFSGNADGGWNVRLVTTEDREDVYIDE